MRWIAAKFVPCLLNNDQRDHCVQVCTELQKAVRHDPNFLSRVITGDESWLYNYDQETKQQSSQWKTPSSPWPKKCTKVTATSSQCWSFFFKFKELCIRSLFHLVRLSMGIFYCEVLRLLRENVGHKRPEMWKTGCCTMTMCLHTPRSWGNSWQKITWPLFPTLPAHLTWPPAISACSLKWNSSWKGSILCTLKRSKQNRNRY